MATGTNIGQLFWQTGIDTTGLRRDSQKAQGALSGLFKPSIIGATALAGAILKAGDAALQFSRDFETAFAEVQTISQSARENADAMRDSLLELTTKIPVQAVDATRALYQIVSAGFDGADAMKVLEVSAKAAVAGVSTTAVAADTLTTIINAYGLEAGEVTDVSDALFKTVELGKTTLSELGASFSQVAGLGAAYKIELNDILAATAQLTSQGASTSEAITRIRGGIVALSKEFGPAVFQGRNLAEAFQFARDEADKAGKGYEEFFGRVEAVVGILGLTGDQLDDYAEKLDKVNTATGSTDAALSVMNTTLESQETLLRNNVNVLLGQFGDTLNNIKKEILPGLNGELQVLADKSIPGYAKALSVLANAFNVGLLAGGKPFSAEQFSPEIVKFQKEAERQVSAFTKRTSKLSNDEFIKEVDRIKILQKENKEAFQDIQDRKEKGQQFDEDQLKRARQSNLTFYKVLESAEKRLGEIREKAPSPGGAGGETPTAKPRIFQDILDDIATAKKAVTDSTKSQIKQASERLKALEKEKQQWLDIANAVEVATETVKEFSKVKAGSVTAFIDPKEAEVATKAIKEQNLEIEKLAKRNDKVEKAAGKAQDTLSSEKGVKNMQVMGAVLDGIAATADLIVTKYGEQLGLSEEQIKVAQDGAQILSGFGDIIEGNFAQGGLKILDSILSQVIPEVEKLSDAFIQSNEQVLKMIDSVNLARTALDQMGSSGDISSLAVLNSQLVSLTKQATDLADSISDVTYGKRDERRGVPPFQSLDRIQEKIEVLNIEIEKLSQRLISGGISDEQRKAIEALLDSYVSLASELDAIITDTIGISVKDLSDSLAEAFLNGETAAESWGKTVDDIIKNVIIKQLSAQFLSKPITDAINKLVADTEGGLSTDEADKFKTAIENIAATTGPAFEAARRALEDIGFDFTGGDTTSDTGISGAIRRELTEETGGLILGQFTAMRVDLKQLNEINLNQTVILEESSGYLQEIAANTSTLELMPAVLSELESLNTNLKNNL